MKKYIVYGTGINAVKFLLDYGLDCIDFFIEEKKELKEFYGKPVLSLSNMIWDKTKMIVVASSDTVYFQIKKALERYGFSEFSDFIYYRLLNKKIACIYGNCHTIPIRKGLELSKEFNDIYGFYPLKQIQQMQSGEEFNQELEVLKYCDLFIHQSIRMDNVYGENYSSCFLLSKLKTSCTVIAIPNLYGLSKCFFPNTSNKKTIFHGEKPYIFNYFPFRDSNIEKAYRQGKSIHQIVGLIEDPETINSLCIQQMFSKFIDKIETREIDWDIKISTFIKTNYNKIQLFYDPNHPTNELIYYITSKLFSILSLDEVDLKRFNILKLDSYEMPIYSAVKRSLNLNDTYKYLRCYSMNTLNLNAMSLEEYVQQYIAWNCILDQKDWE